MSVPLNAEHARDYFDLFGAAPRAPESANPRIKTPNVDPRLHPNQSPRDSLVEQLGATVDGLRQLYTDLGARPYRVFSVVFQWSGGAAGQGEAQVISELEFLPTPLIAVNARRVATAAGVTFDGTAQLSQVSARYSEANINALFPTELAQGQQSFIEVRLDARDGANPVLRRYTVVDIPEICPLKFEWRARLEIQQDDRDRFTKKVDPLTFYPARMREET